MMSWWGTLTVNGRPVITGVVLFALTIGLIILQSSSISSGLKSFSAIYDEAVVSNVATPFEVERVNVSSAGVGVASADVVAAHAGSEGIAVEEPLTAVTPAPDVVIEASVADEIMGKATRRSDNEVPKDSCDYSTAAFEQVAVLNKSNGQWRYPQNGADFCGGRSGTDLRLPVDAGQILRHFSGKRIVFMGDSVARNSFVLTMARLCNAENFDKCITRCPTVEYDVTNPPHNRGPMGCVPTPTAVNVNSSSASHSTSPPNPAELKSDCYREGKFANIPLKGLTLRSVPQDRNGRRNFIRKNLIGPVMGMSYRNVSLFYHPVTKPNQLTRTGLWMARHPNSLLHGDVIIVSIGPHLRLPEVQQTPETLIQGLAAVRAATSAPIIAAEFVHALGSNAAYITFVDDLMQTLREKMRTIGVTMVPQRFITRHGFMLTSGNVMKSEAPGTPQKGCGYYDAQHPALRCQMVTSDMLLATALRKIMLVAENAMLRKA